MRPIVTEVMNENLETEPTSEEIRIVVFQMHHTKAPGTDAFHALFYQKFWDVVGDDMVCFVKSWWRGLIDLKEVNQTCISLIPECNNQRL